MGESQNLVSRYSDQFLLFGFRRSSFWRWNLLFCIAAATNMPQLYKLTHKRQDITMKSLTKYPQIATTVILNKLTTSNTTQEPHGTATITKTSSNCEEPDQFSKYLQGFTTKNQKSKDHLRIKINNQKIQKSSKITNPTNGGHLSSAPPFCFHFAVR